MDWYWWGQGSGQGWAQFLALGYTLVLCSVIGLEREIRHKSAGVRTHAIVGLGAALFVLVGKYGYGDVLEPGRVVLDPSRVTAQVVSGIGFIGAGIIFVRRDAVRGLTTASAIWASAAVGTACGAGLPGLAGAVTVGYLVVVYIYPRILRMIPAGQEGREPVRLRYLDGHGLLRQILGTATDMGFSVTHIDTKRLDNEATVRLLMDVEGRGDPVVLAERLASIEGVFDVSAGRRDEIDDSENPEE